MTKVTNDGRKSLGEVLSGPALALLEAAPQDLWPRLASLCSRAISSVNQVLAPPISPLPPPPPTLTHTQTHTIA